ncbi:UNVERIFIED_CONTAM: hypothetical protein GTU68_029040 [Idotea baltica]|nr:hypothetical protein [Idotea baltica]
MLEQALEIYRATFRPSETLRQPYAIVAAGVCSADTDEEAQYLRSSQMLAFARLRTGTPGKLPPPVQDVESQIPAQILPQIQHALSISAVGSPATVKRQLKAIIDTHKPDELIVTGTIHDHAARIRSFQTVGEILQGLCD